MLVGTAAVLAAGFVALTARQLILGQLAVALIAAGMATMALGMAFPAGHVVQGPWWATGFAVVALWACRPWWPMPARQLHHLVAGVAMVYMCAAWPASLSTGSISEAPLPSHHFGGAAGAALLDASDPSAAVGDPAAGLALPLVGWLLACYFVLYAIGVATRRRDDGTAGRREPALDEAAMGVGMAVMLLGMI